MSPYVFFIVFNDTTFIPFNSNDTSHVNTHFHFHSCFRFAIPLYYAFIANDE